jgi:hypothetical protein
MLRLIFLLPLLYLPAAAQWIPLLKKGLDGWQQIGPGVWTVTREGVLIGQRDLALPRTNTEPDQAWLYTVAEFGQYDLHAECWTRLRGNSGISIRDATRARYSYGKEADPKRTPARNGYEIQISNGYKDKFPSGSIYLFQPAASDLQIENDWNAYDIEVRDNMIRVKLNGKLAAEHAGDPARPKKGPIGLQLHDRDSIVMFRNIRLREVKGR